MADRCDPADLHGPLVCLHVGNVPGYLAQQRDIPIDDQELNRSFPGKERSNTAERMAYQFYRRLVSQCVHLSLAAPRQLSELHSGDRRDCNRPLDVC